MGGKESYYHKGNGAGRRPEAGPAGPTRYHIEPAVLQRDEAALHRVGTILQRAQSASDVWPLTAFMLPSTAAQEGLNPSLDYCLPTHIMETVRGAIRQGMRLEQNSGPDMELLQLMSVAALTHDSGKIAGSNGQHPLVSREYAEAVCARLRAEGAISAWVAETAPVVVGLHHGLWDTIAGSYGMSESSLQGELPGGREQTALAVFVEADMTSWRQGRVLWETNIAPHVLTILPLAG